MTPQEDRELLQQAIAKQLRGEDLSEAEIKALTDACEGEPFPSDEKLEGILSKLKALAEEGGEAVEPQERGSRSALLQQARRAFQTELPELLKTHPRQWVAYRGADRIGFGPTKTQLTRECIQRRVPYEELFVRMVQPDIPPTRLAR